MLLSFTTWPPVFDKLKGGAGMLISFLYFFTCSANTTDKSYACSMITWLIRHFII